MAAKKPHNPRDNLTMMGKGRARGVPNKATRQVKDMIQDCFEKIGGLQGFATWAAKNRTDFYKLYGKLLPIQLQSAGSKGAFEIIISKDEEKL